jgi:hypothetical protein
MNTKEDNVIDLEEAVRARRKKDPPGGNWLAELPKDTRFLASLNAGGGSTLGDFLIGTDPKQMPAVLLGFELAHRDGGFRWVDPVKFSRDYTFFMTVEINGHGPEVQDGRVEGDGKPEVVHSVHEDEQRD